MIAILTCPRPGGVIYLDGLLTAFANEVPDAQLLILRDSWGYLQRPPNNRDAAWQALENAANADEDLLFLEDDVRPARAGALEEMMVRPVPEGAAWTSFYHPDRAYGVYDAGGFMYSQAIKFPPRSAVVLARARGSWPWLNATGFDLALASVGTHLGLRYEQGPILVEHIGAVSAAESRR